MFSMVSESVIFGVGWWTGIEKRTKNVQKKRPKKTMYPTTKNVKNKNIILPL